jgi:LysW-gamma-L-lysine carboxypeptidase
LLQSLVEAYSPSGSEQQVASLLLDEMNAKGFDSRIDKAGNVIGQIGEEGPRILLCGHMDTVPGDIPVRVEDGFLYGRGAVDAKSSLAAMMVGCISAIEGSPNPFQVTLTGVVEEETTSAGIESIISQQPSYDVAVFGEPSGTSNIIIGYKGSLRVRVTLLTSGGHSASPWLSQNSIEEAFRFWASFRKEFINNDSMSKFSQITGSMVRMESGDGSNTIPSQADLEIDLRVPPSLSPGKIVEKMVDFTRAYQSGDHQPRIQMSFANQTPPYLGHQDSVLVRAFRSAIRSATGKPVTLLKKTGTSDMNLLNQSLQIPMIAYGPGDSSLDHTNNERVKLEEYLKSIEIYAAAIQKLSSILRRPLIPSMVPG